MLIESKLCESLVHPKSDIGKPGSLEMKIVSVNVSLPRTVRWKNRDVTTGIFKEPVQGRVIARKLDLDGDQQADLTVHGGVNKAIYGYPTDHYSFWRSELPGMDLPWGMFGENLSIEGLREDETRIGDRFQVGTALLMATQPRIPCYKLAVKFGRDDILKRFLQSEKSGVYFSVLKEGFIQAGDMIEKIHQDDSGISVTDINRLYAWHRDDAPMLRRVVHLEALPQDWRDYFGQQLEMLEQ
jgi:MOSC domain-containing protein YiiM